MDSNKKCAECLRVCQTHAKENQVLQQKMNYDFQNLNQQYVVVRIECAGCCVAECYVVQIQQRLDQGKQIQEQQFEQQKMQLMMQFDLQKRQLQQRYQQALQNAAYN